MQNSYSQRLSEFDSQLRGQGEDGFTLHELRDAIKRLLPANAGGETDIRRLLQRGLQAGQIPEETAQLVLGVLDGIVSEGVPTAPGLVPPTLDEQDPFGSTTVIPVAAVQDITADEKVQLGSVLRDRFQLQERVAEGSMGVVYMPRRARSIKA